MSDCPCKHSQPDRYVSFDGIDCDGNAAHLMQLLLGHLADPAKCNAFWTYFLKKRRPASGPAPDDLFLIHCHLNQLREFFELHEDEQAMGLLERLELECC